MHGYGVYTWPDGRKYEGQYKDDMKYGFGIYTWSDGRVYQGWWLNRKQCGLGTYIAKGGNSLNIVERKYGLWHVGKRLKWFTKEEVKEIKKGNKDYLTLINDENDCEEILKHQANFNPPSFFKFKSSLL